VPDRESNTEINSHDENIEATKVNLLSLEIMHFAKKNFFGGHQWRTASKVN
jgi:hypothetical protein